MDRLEISVGPAGVYVLAIGPLPGITNGLLAIFHSSDRRLIVNTESGTTYVSADHGETFTPAHADVAVSQVWWTRVDYLATAQSQPGAYLSEDGRHWRKLTME